MHSGRQLRVWQIATLILCLVTYGRVVCECMYLPRAVIPGEEGSLGVKTRWVDIKGRIDAQIVGMDPESPLLRQGVGIGDVVVYPQMGRLRTGESVTAQVAHRGTLRRVNVTAVYISSERAPLQDALDAAEGVLALVLASIIALRRSRDLGALVFACSLFLGADVLTPELEPSALAPGMDFLLATGLILFLPLFAYFHLTFDGGYSSALRPWLVRAVIVLCAACGIWALIEGCYDLGFGPIRPAIHYVWLRPALLLAGLALNIVAFSDAWRRADGERRARMRWICVSFGFVAIAFSIYIASGSNVFGENGRLIKEISNESLVGASLILMTYAVLRHRVIDIGFVVNRTLVFATFTGLLLVSFGIIEWLVDKILHFAQRERNAVVDAAIAVLLYLALHRLRDSIEHFISRVFFRTWHEREAALIKFWEQTPHFTSAEALEQAVLAAVDAYTGGCGSGIYRIAEAAVFKLEGSTLKDLPGELPADTGAIVEMKAHHQPVGLSRRNGFGSAVLAFPMLRRSELVGFLIVGPKFQRDPYRPDEIENLARTALRTAPDFYALRLEQVERRGRELEQQNDALSRELRGRLGSIASEPLPADARQT